MYIKYSGVVYHLLLASFLLLINSLGIYSMQCMKTLSFGFSEMHFDLSLFLLPEVQLFLGNRVFDIFCVLFGNEYKNVWDFQELNKDVYCIALWLVMSAYLFNSSFF
ncbi:uncharacterized protein NESG_00462 [Nematocida ausubeli]|uniref:Uncharacterized protein n=1 Tax=Nematocida ausubeli (strain ATCC PRA-371 / ERTm2) TaxID=1913371 RepID=A0A086J5G6_NEMA1|nr:uncharacterized protein NESG_00462 [Nematocida ausubeli]KFG27384.1 hypothetical protein NESG_00462 [Nematocida ausubeli]